MEGKSGEIRGAGVSKRDEGRGEARKSILRSTSVSLMTFAFLLTVF